MGSIFESLDIVNLIFALIVAYLAISLTRLMRGGALSRTWKFLAIGMLAFVVIDIGQVYETVFHAELFAEIIVEVLEGFGWVMLMLGLASFKRSLSAKM